jgi:hypothetical protein
MTAWKKILIYTVISIFFTGCIDLVEKEFPNPDPIAVVNAIMINDSLIEVHLSKIMSLSNAKDSLIDNAQINLYSDTSFIESLVFTDAYYISSTRAKPNTQYSFEVSIPGFGTLYGTDSVPSIPVTKILSQNNRAGLNDEGFYYSSIEFSFQDDPSSVDYYEIAILKKYFDRHQFAATGNGEYHYYSKAFNKAYGFLLSEGFEPYSTNTLVFSDEYLSPDIDLLKLNYGFEDFGIGMSDGVRYQTINDHTLIIEVRRISHEYYRYKKQFYLYEKGRYGELVEGVVTPFQNYSNVENGSGIIAAYSLAIDSIHIETERIPLN